VATEYHLTPEGPRRCAVDHSNPNSRGCPLGGMHFDSLEDAMDVYTEDLKQTFGDFHVLVRPSLKEKARRAGYLSLEGVEKAKANPQVQAAVSTMKTLRAKAREAAEEIRGHYQKDASADRSSTLPESVQTEPLGSIDAEAEQAESNSEELFSGGSEESMKDFGARIAGRASSDTFSLIPVDRTEFERRMTDIEARETLRKLPAPKPGRRLRAYRSATRRKLNTAKDQARTALTNGSLRAQTKLSDASYAARASVSVAKDTAELRARVAAAKAQDRADDLARSLRQKASRMSVPAGHIRPGDTFDGTTVRSVELLDSGKVKISYQAAPGGPILAATVPGDRSMRVDRKTRREARNSRISSKVAKPIAQSKELSRRVAKASERQLSALSSIGKRDVRIGAIEYSIRQHERSVKQKDLIDRLRGLRSPSRTSERELQLS